MKTLRTLLKSEPGLRLDDLRDIEIASLSYDSRKVSDGALFFALPGAKADGSAFASQAVERGAAAVVTEAPHLDLPVPVARVTRARAAMARAACEFFEHPADALKVFGVTGTNGKTTTAFIIQHLCRSSNMPCGLMGTVRYETGEEVIVASRTTPESVEIQELLARMRTAGCRAVSMEVSSHALAQDRLVGIAFDAAVFTNLTQDHLDYHETMEAYFEAKALLFEQLARQAGKHGKAVINIDDRHGKLLVDRFAKSVRCVTYGQASGANYRATRIQGSPTGTTFALEAPGRSLLVRLPLIGSFNVYNALGALAAAHSAGLDLRGCVQALESIPQVPGRLERVPASRSFQVFVDYAHTPDALENALKTLRELNPRKLIVVFGCGGDRDKAKRPMMGRIAEAHADFAIVTSDNPRTEVPAHIIEDILQGMHAGRDTTIVDRKEAIEAAVQLAAPRDIVLIAGKGHETYQEFADRTIDFNDVAVARAAMRNLAPERQ